MLDLLFAQSALPEQPLLDCVYGYVVEEIAGNEWQISSCDQDSALIFVAVESFANGTDVIARYRSGDDFQFSHFGRPENERSRAALEALRLIGNEQFQTWRIEARRAYHSAQNKPQEDN